LCHRGHHPDDRSPPSDESAKAGPWRALSAMMSRNQDHQDAPAGQAAIIRCGSENTRHRYPCQSGLSMFQHDQQGRAPHRVRPRPVSRGSVLPVSDKQLWRRLDLRWKNQPREMREVTLKPLGHARRKRRKPPVTVGVFILCDLLCRWVPHNQTTARPEAAPERKFMAPGIEKPNAKKQSSPN
jgi:hypothetical protein